MEILPTDLGLGWGISLIQSRAATASSHSSRRGGILRQALQASARPRLGPFGRFWTQGTGLPDEAKAELLKNSNGVIAGPMIGLSAASMAFAMPTIMTFAHGHPEAGVFFAAIWLGMASTGILMPRVLLARWTHNPISLTEAEAMLEGKEDSLERSYLSLIRDAIKQDIAPQAAEEVRKAIRALGDAIERLPPVTVGREVSAGRLREEAAQVQEQAAHETDAVTAASMLRQAEALLRSAQASERASLVLKRNTALRNELTAQTEALRLGLASLFAGAGDMNELTRLAEQVRGVATEANAVADARTELEAFLSTSAATTPGVQKATAGADHASTAVVTPVTAPTVQISLRK